jgi:hypothetical protein
MHVIQYYCQELLLRYRLQGRGQLATKMSFQELLILNSLTTSVA